MTNAQNVPQNQNAAESTSDANTGKKSKRFPLLGKGTVSSFYSLSKLIY